MAARGNPIRSTTAGSERPIARSPRRARARAAVTRPAPMTLRARDGLSALSCALAIVLTACAAGTSGTAGAPGTAPPGAIGPAAPAPTPADALQPGDTLVVPVPGTPVRLTLAFIPGADPFWMTVHEVTHDQYAPFRYRRLDEDIAAAGIPYAADAVTRPSPPYEDPVHGMGKGSHPAGGMTRGAALRYARWLSEKTGRLLTLPTESQWERACRAGGTGPYGRARGGDPAVGAGEAVGLDDVAWYESNSGGAFHPVGAKSPNAWGLHDLHGNVAEWVLRGADDTERRGVVKGGAFDDPATAVRCDARFEEPAAWQRRDPQIPKSRWWNTDSPHVGFRLISPAREHTPEEIRAYWAALLGGS